MPLRIIGDHREILIDIFFAVIIAIGFESFIREFFKPSILHQFHQLSSFDLTSLIKVFSAHEILLDTLFFLATLFWVISHWVFYHELIERYPYYNWPKFYVDISLFSLMFVIINISYLAYDKAVTPLFILLIDIWYLFACLWHLSDRKLRPIARYLKRHIWRLVTYSGLLVLIYDPISIEQIAPWYRDIIMVGTILAMMIWNIHRVSRFVKRNLREYRCGYVQGYPGWHSPYKGGTLELVRFPIGAKEKNTITFRKKKSSEKRRRIQSHSIAGLTEFIIQAQNTNSVFTTTIQNEEYSNDLLLVIVYKHENGKEITLVLKLSALVINGVKKAIQEMREREKE